MSADLVRRLLDAMGHTQFDHDFIKDENACPRCRLRAEARRYLERNPGPP